MYSVSMSLSRIWKRGKEGSIPLQLEWSDESFTSFPVPLLHETVGRCVSIISTFSPFSRCSLFPSGKERKEEEEKAPLRPISFTHFRQLPLFRPPRTTKALSGGRGGQHSPFPFSHPFATVSPQKPFGCSRRVAMGGGGGREREKWAPINRTHTHTHTQAWKQRKRVEGSSN